MTTQDVLAGMRASTNNEVRFRVGEEDIIVLDREGLWYKGEHIADAGEAHKHFILAMQCMWRATIRGTLSAHELMNVLRLMREDPLSLEAIESKQAE